mgnify:CR=1 FL=1
MMKIMYTNNDGEGFHGFVEVEVGTTVDQFTSDRLDGDIDKYLVKVNSRSVPGNTVLAAGDRVSCSPAKIEGN